MRRILRAPEVPSATGDPERIAEVQQVLAGLRPLLEADGGDVRLVAVDAGRITLSFEGACRSCSALASTLASGVEPELRRQLAWVDEVQVTG